MPSTLSHLHEQARPGEVGGVDSDAAVGGDRDCRVQSLSPIFVGRSPLGAFRAAARERQLGSCLPWS